MQERNEPAEKSRLEQLHDVIANSATAIEQEFQRSPNDWLSCFGSKIFVIETYLDMQKVQELLAPEVYQRSLARMEALKERLAVLKEQYPARSTVVPREVREDLIVALDVLAPL